MLFFSYVLHWLIYNFHLSKRGVREQSLSNLSTCLPVISKQKSWSLYGSSESVKLPFFNYVYATKHINTDINY